MNKIKKMLCLLLLAAMIFSLAACGKNGQDGNKGKPTDTPTPEFVYTSTFRELSNGNNGYINAELFTNDGFYYVRDEKVGEMEHEGQTPEWEGQFDITEQRLYFMGFDGNSKKLEGFEPVRSEEDNGHNFSSYIRNLAQSSDGGFITLENAWEEWSDAPDGTPMYSDEWYQYQHYESKTLVRVLDADGAELSRTELDPGQGDGNYFQVWDMVVGDDGMLLCSCDEGIMAFDPATGKKAYEIGNTESLNYVEKLLRLRDGRVCALGWGERSSQLATIDSASKSLGKSEDFPGDPYSSVAGSGEYDLYYTSGINFYGYNIETGKSEKLFNWISCDVNNDELQGNYAVNENGEVIGISNSWDSKTETSTCELITISREPFDPAKQKTVLTLATQYVNWEDRNMIIKFNRNNDKYRIEVVDYSEYNTDDDYEAGLKKLKTELMAGNLPDILCLNGLSGAQLASRGIITDLYPLMDADTEFDRGDFFPNVLAAMEYDGMLYSTIGTFNINTVCGAASVVGSEPGWTYADLEAALATMPEGCEVFDYYTTRNMVLESCLGLDMEDYVNWATGECRFDSQQFVDLLNFANKFPAEFDWENYEYSDQDDDITRVAQGKQMLLMVYLYDFLDIARYQYTFGNDINNLTFIGYPTNNGVGNMLNISAGGYAITRSCSAPEGAWQFLRTFFTEEYQGSENSWGFPSNRKAFNAKLEEAMTPEYMKDADGNFVLDENGERIEISHYGMGFANGESLDVYALTQEQADKIIELVENTTKVRDYNTAIFDIVKEQSEAFFAGQKSAEEVAKLVQSKANIFVNEQR